MRCSRSTWPLVCGRPDRSTGSLCFACCGYLTDALQYAWLPTGGTIAWGDLATMALWGAGAAFAAARRFKWLPAG